MRPTSVVTRVPSPVRTPRPRLGPPSPIPVTPPASPRRAVTPWRRRPALSSSSAPCTPWYRCGRPRVPTPVSATASRSRPSPERPAPTSVSSSARVLLPPVRKACAARACTRSRAAAALDRELGGPESDVLRELHHHAHVVARHKAQLVQRALVVGRRRVCVGQQTWRGGLQRARLAEDVARVDGAEVLLGDAPAGGAVGVYCAESVAGKWVAVFGCGGCDRTEGGQDLAEGRVLPVRWLSLVNRL